MYVMVTNFSGNVGKSTLTRYMLSPRMENAKAIPIETINAHDGDSDDNLKGKQYGQLIEGLALFDNAIVDVGSSNVADTISLMQQYKGSHEIFDYFVVPVIHRDKQIKDTISTIEALAAIGVPPEKIRLVFNMVENSEVQLERDFWSLFAYHKAEKTFTLNKKAVVYQHDFFSRATGKDITVESVLDDTTDFNALIKAASTPEEKVKYSQQRALKWLAAELQETLDAAFKATFK
ncbi:StbB family protein [Cellvibrio sp. OA-2007]|uniref:StbB family protein n=1 Tax=Cellvibrio sp. OA-2007 TaxID=529823 RepID=UPI000A48FAF2|nr:StbB family protein [Cellvibrio sp. OA-2007]